MLRVSFHNRIYINRTIAPNSPPSHTSFKEMEILELLRMRSFIRSLDREQNLTSKIDIFENNLNILKNVLKF